MGMMKMIIYCLLRCFLCKKRRYVITAILVFCMLSILSFNISLKENYFVELWRDSRTLYNPLQANVECSREHTMPINFQPTPVYDDGKSGEVNNSGLTSDARILFLVESRFTQFGAQISFVLDSLKIPFKAQTPEKWLPYLAEELNSRRSVYKIIIFENLFKYLNLALNVRQMLDEYCKRFKVGIISFMPTRPDSRFAREKMKGFPIHVRQNLKISKLYMNAFSDLYYLTKFGDLPSDILNKTDSSWVGFEYPRKYYNSILNGAISESDSSPNKQNISLVLLDKGKYDGIRKLLFGHKFDSLWLLKLLFVDGIKFLSENIFGLSRVRYLQIDIDDIFLGEKSKKMTADDVKALLEAQETIRSDVPNFTFNLGFCGKFFGRNGYYEDEGDYHLVALANRFWWFSHFWNHGQAHGRNFSDLVDDSNHNKFFAKEHSIPIKWPYAVSPHHSGVYPVHEPLYKAWREIWNITVTSTEQYPHLRPASRRRGFVHDNVQVLPRQTCGLYTHTTLIDYYPGGRDRLDSSIQGGELFFTFVLNKFLIFMTHQSNYAQERLALYTFRSVLRFIRCYTNIELRSVPPPVMADKYFAHYPSEKEPIWSNPCIDKRHVSIWALEKLCNRVPHFIAVGPQKTGTTALHKFLKLHPQIMSNYASNKTFEEIQFFNGKYYMYGIEWYLNRFPSVNKSGIYLFEKSSTYFDSESSPKRLKAFIPDAKIIVTIVNPIDRAYSWYQHMIKHNDTLATNLEFLTVIRSNNKFKNISALRNRCLQPGHYAEHLERWLEQFPAKQIIILDGDVLKRDPIKSMQIVQKFLNVEERIDYRTLLRYSPSKKFYCVITHQNKTDCLGRSKGSYYDPMESAAKQWLSKYYRSHNIALHRLLKRLGYPVPKWLIRELKLSVSNTSLVP